LLSSKPLRVMLNTFCSNSVIILQSLGQCTSGYDQSDSASSICRLCFLWEHLDLTWYTSGRYVIYFSSFPPFYLHRGQL